MDGPGHSQNVDKWSGWKHVIYEWSRTFTEHSKMVWEIVYRIHTWSRTFTECPEKAWEFFGINVQSKARMCHYMNDPGYYKFFHRPFKPLKCRSQTNLHQNQRNGEPYHQLNIMNESGRQIGMLKVDL
jgi:hypothetical protein